MGIEVNFLSFIYFLRLYSVKISKMTMKLMRDHLRVFQIILNFDKNKYI